ncbi:MAG: Acetyl-CoA decarbonylase/synthase complex subunit gamma [Methanomassiliicoccales archaeon PtaU1.Bin124]|nr:MAG: Acetyl-CoA decarbonylase/synthase complex subunit gamma [Methanomassiliicoccales archaeon PtaU1.Bin124]
MAIEEIDLYKLKADEIENYLPTDKSPPEGYKKWGEFAQALVEGKVKATSCTKIDNGMAEVMDAVLSIGIRLPESDPMQQKVPQPLLEFNHPDESSPILITSNSIITHQILKLVLETAKVKAFVIPVDTNGYTLDNAVVAGAFSPMEVMKALTNSGITDKTSCRRAMLPGLAKDLKNGIERVTRWTYEIGPVSIFELPLYLKVNC